jgi:aminoglycoside 2'-N-acetyltransferase I
MKLEFVAMDQLSDRQNNAIQQLRSAVYPPEVLATLPGIAFTWASAQWSVLLWDQDELVAKVGLHVREIICNEETKTIGGVGGVMTHPARQGQGLASQAMKETARLFEEELKVSFALLFCRPHLVEFYRRLKWKPFQGSVFVEQPDGRIEFSANGAMVLDVKEEAPVNGTLDLNGLPW